MSVVAAQMNNAVFNDCICWCHIPQSPNYGKPCTCVCKNVFKIVSGSMQIIEDEDVSPMVKQMQVLEKRIVELEQENRMRQDTIACVDQAYNEECEKLEKRIDELQNTIEHLKLKDKFCEKIQRKLNELEQNLQDISFNHIERINNLEQHRKYQIEENRKESRLIDELQNQLSNSYEQIRDIRELRYADNQDLGCTKAKVNDMSDAIEDLAKKVDGLQDNANGVLELWGKVENVFNSVAELSIKVNQQNSSLREFEKQVIDPRLERLEEVIPRYDQLHKEWWNRIENLESLIDIKKMEQIILDGANLHAEVLRLTQKLQSADLKNIKPHLYPRCNGDGFALQSDSNGGNVTPCKPCKSEGIVWE